LPDQNKPPSDNWTTTNTRITHWSVMTATFTWNSLGATCLGHAAKLSQLCRAS
jgi:hypothetical protein